MEDIAAHPGSVAVDVYVLGDDIAKSSGWIGRGALGLSVDEKKGKQSEHNDAKFHGMCLSIAGYFYQKSGPNGRA